MGTAVDDLQDRVAEICGQLNVLHAQLVDVVVEALDNGLWEQWGIRSPEHWLAWQAGMSPGHARQIVAAARRRRELPVTFAAFADGELSIDQVATVVRHARSHNDAEVCELAKAATVAQLRSVLGKYVYDEPTNTEPAVPSAVPSAPDARDQAMSWFDDQQRFRMVVNAPPDRGAVIQHALAEARDALFHAGSPQVTWLDALVEVCHRSLDTITSASRRDRYRIYVHLDTDGPDGAAHAWLNAGPTLPHAVRDRIVCDGVVQPLWLTGGLPVNIGRAQRITPERVRRLVLDRDRTCRVPTCQATEHLEVHHIVPWIAGGATDTHNLCGLCPRDHDAYHRGQFTITGNADIPGDLQFRDARGRPIPTSAQPRPPDRPPPQPTKPYVHPTGERWNGHWLMLNPEPKTRDPAA